MRGEMEFCFSYTLNWLVLRSGRGSVSRAFSHSAARGETVIGDSPGGQLRPIWVQLIGDVDPGLVNLHRHGPREVTQSAMTSVAHLVRRLANGLRHSAFSRQDCHLDRGLQSERRACFFQLSCPVCFMKCPMLHSVSLTDLSVHSVHLIAARMSHSLTEAGVASGQIQKSLSPLEAVPREHASRDNVAETPHNSDMLLTHFPCARDIVDAPKVTD